MAVMHSFWVSSNVFYVKVIQIKLAHSFKTVKLNRNTKVSGKLYISIILLFLLGIPFCFFFFQNLIRCCKNTTINKALFFCMFSFFNNEAGKLNRTIFQIKFVFFYKCYTFVHVNFLPRSYS
jgi:hypothetical protein